MTPAEWQRVREVLETALELAPARRAAFLDEARLDAPLRLEVELMLKLSDSAGDDFMSEPAAAEIFPEVAEPVESATRVGPYEIQAEIARGGMGKVYRAIRVDGQFTQEVALKIVRAGIGASMTAVRFRNERQILSNLDHPNIARLLDGGTTEDGRPYFVMELIDGLPITEYCERAKLTVRARAELFVRVCVAVQHAHQRLVIHRDIKPTNILITKDGVPKLLDFGIAKVLDPAWKLDGAARTVEGRWMMTPEYASPEQIRGEAVTTATDVYSLGLVFYELLAGCRAHEFAGTMPHEVAQVITSAEPERPSVAAAALGSGARAAKELRGDLDNIVLMALRKDPARRYASVEQFAEDVRRYLRHEPVSARDDSAWYRTTKFVQRHRTWAAASAIVVATIFAGLGVTLYEARVARQQAEIARQQRARAERRFNDVRALANSLMFEIHDSIKDLPGNIPARKLLVARAAQYLDSLSQEAAGDPALERELAAAYDRVGICRGTLRRRTKGISRRRK